jgi:Protein of unknown function (DUF3551)
MTLSRHATHSKCLLHERVSHVLFTSMAKHLRPSHVGGEAETSLLKPTHRDKESDDEADFEASAAPAAVLGAAAFFATATPAAATDYCRTEVTAGTRGCGYTSLEQCQTMSSGRGGTCDVNPFPAGGSGDPSNAFAYQPKPGSKNRVKSVGKQ